MSKLNLKVKQENAGEPSFFGKSLKINDNKLDMVRKNFRAAEPELAKSAEFNFNNVEGISKSFVAGTGITPDTQPDAAALRTESLDNDVKIVTWGPRNFTLFADVARQPINQTVAKYVVYYNHGRVGHTLFQPEIGLGRVDNPNLKQKTVTMKFLAAPAQTSMVMQRANVIEDPIRIQEMGALNRLGKTIEWAMFYGDSDLSDGEAQSGYEFDGLTKLIDSENIIDQRGGALTPSLLNKAATYVAVHGFGIPNAAYMPTGVKADFVNNYLGAQRVIDHEGSVMTAGFDIDQFRSVRGKIALRDSAIMDIDNALDESNDVEDNAPLTPNVTAAVATGQNGNFVAEDVKDSNGNVVVPAEVGKALSYKVVAVGDADSAPSDAVTATPANATDGVTLTIALSPLAKKAPKYVAIYRASLIDETAGKYFLVARVPMSKFDATTGAITFTDVDDVIPGTADVFMGELSEEVINLFEFLPVTKLNTAVVTDATNFALMWWGALRLSFPKRWVWIKNVRYASKDTETKFD